jgi:hypothetical protein
MSEYWWARQTKGEETRRRVMASWTHVDAMQGDLRARANANWGIYLGRRGVDLDASGWTLQGRTYSKACEDRRENIIRSAIGALVAKISSNRPLPRVMTDGGDFLLQKQAKLAQLWIEGILDESGAYALSRQIFLDACLMPLGLLKIYPDDERGAVGVERVLRTDLSVDPHDARNGRPRTLFQHMVVSREVLAQRYGSKTMAVAGAALTNRTMADVDAASVIDPVSVVEAWHLPSGPKAKDGRHVICTQAGEPLLDAEWTRERLPFAAWRWSTQPLGWDGVPAVDELLPYQEMHDYLSSRIDVMIEQCKSRIAVDPNAKVNMDAYDSPNRETGFFSCTGKTPEVMNDPGPPVALLMERERIKAAAFEQIGMSQLTSQSQLPRGVESRVAMQEYKDTESERFLDVGQAWEEFFCGAGGIADLIMDAAEDMGSDIIVRPSDGKVTREVRWSEISAIRKDMRVSVRPASFLPTSPAERIARIEALAQVAPMPPAMLARMIDHPDVDAALGHMTAAEDAIRFDIEAMEDGETVQPEPFVDVDMALGMVLAHRNKLRAQGAPPELLKGFTTYMLRLSEMKASMVRGAGQVAGAGAPESVATAALSTPGVEGTVQGMGGPPMGPGPEMGPPPGMGGPGMEMPPGMPDGMV